MKEVSKLVERDFPEFWKDESSVNKESRKNTIDVYYNVRMKLEEMTMLSGLKGYTRLMHINATMGNIKAEFKYVLLKQQMDALTVRNAALEARIDALEQNKMRKTKHEVS